MLSPYWFCPHLCNVSNEKRDGVGQIHRCSRRQNMFHILFPQRRWVDSFSCITNDCRRGAAVLFVARLGVLLLTLTEAKTKMWLFVETLTRLRLAVHGGLSERSDKHSNILVFRLINWIVCCLGLQLLTVFIWWIVWSFKMSENSEKCQSQLPSTQGDISRLLVL